MSHPILITGAAGGPQGSTGRVIATLLLEQGVPVRAFVHKLDARSDEHRQKGAEIIEGDLLNPASVQAAMKDVKRAYFTYPVADGLLEAATIFATSARDAGVELVVNNSQFQGTPKIPYFAIFNALRHSGICSTGWLIVFSTGRRLGPFIFKRHPISKTYARLSPAAWPSKMPRSYPGGDGDAVIPLAGAEDVARVAATLLAASNAPSEKVYPLVSETLTVRQIVETLGKAIGRPIRYVPITDEQWADAVKERINPHALDHLTHLWRYFRNSKEPRRATNAIREVTGRNPQTLEEFFRANANSIGAAGQ